MTNSISLVKHIHKTSRDGADRYNKNISSDEEWSHIIDEVKQQEPSDPMAPKERIIAFSNKFQHTTKEAQVKEKSAQLKDQFSTTDQYFKFANGMIKDKVEKIKQLKDNEERFSGEMNLLQNRIKTRYELEKLNPKYATENDARSLLSILEEEFERMKDKLLYRELIVQKTKDEIAKKRAQIDKVKDDLKNRPHRLQKEISDPIATLKEELIRAGIPPTDKIFQIIDKISDRLSTRFFP